MTKPTHDFIEDLMLFGVHKYDFNLVPEMWKQHEKKAKLDWQRFKFDEAILSSIPSERGIYAFCIEPEISDNLNICYLMYIGETNRPLRTRFREYLVEADAPNGRPAVKRLLLLYKEFLYSYCARAITLTQVSD